MNDHSNLMVRVLSSYSGVGTAQRELAEFDSLRLGEGLSEGLHAAETPEDVASLLAAGAPINGLRNIPYDSGNEHWETALLTALVDGRHRVALALIAHGADVDAPNRFVAPGEVQFDHTALHGVVKHDDLEAARVLLGAGADVNRQITLGATPLFFAAADDNLDMVRLLLSAGADPDVPDFGGRLPADVAGDSTRHLLV